MAITKSACGANFAENVEPAAACRPRIISHCGERSSHCYSKLLNFNSFLLPPDAFPNACARHVAGFSDKTMHQDKNVEQFAPGAGGGEIDRRARGCA
jgi:hypothetical protein